ncbi:Putative threonine efflux protein [Methanocella conradii HZ254]|uniref:Threonine efflux protein n=1 Tax=Methanocella conradii (strain DSM 24694 / JCM 17849 / CGMCC 1.5162 / HZ254) TaxID=1041930 RepID=H8I9F8_METCZ|nr:LysE family transporter [Methanocella conradii]AFD00003.1 Putative threonine efflux protein [Methanocella conradii HZ254]MDI6897347.1 LysE family transporter [Methanocella conradii]
MFDLYSLLAGIFIGLSLAVPPGPVNAIIAAESVKRSYLAGIKVGLGAMTADATFLFITLIGIAVLFTGETVKMMASVAGSLILAYMAVKILKGHKKPLKESGKEDIKNHYMTGVIVGITNPASILWWVTAGAALIANFNAPGIAGFFIGIFIWVSSFSITLHFAQKKVEWLYPVIMLASGLVLLFFSVMLLYNAIMMAL